MILTLLGAICISGCAVTPEVQDRETIPYHGNEETGGFVQILENGSVEVDQEIVTEYNELLSKYGTMFIPEVKQNDGVTSLVNGNYAMTLQGMEHLKQLRNFHEYMTRLERAHNK